MTEEDMRRRLTTTQPLIVFSVLVATAVLSACLPRVPVPHARCHPFCTLDRAAHRSRVEVGLFPQDFGPESRAVIARESGMIVNHHLSWNVIEPARGVWNFGPADEVHAFALQHRLREFGFHFAWDNDLLDDFPAWVGEITDADELRSVIRERARRIFQRYPTLAAVDVINEPLATLGSAPTENHFFRVLGADYIAQLFEIVEAEAQRSTRLFINENFVEYIPAKADALVALVADLLERGISVDAVGLQTHLLLGEPDWALLHGTIERLAGLGVAIMITELDVPVTADVPDRREVQAERYRRVVDTCLAVRSCDTINIWGVDDGHTWLDGLLGPGTDPLLFDADFQPKPAYFAVRDELRGGRP
jgi:endo-1,4-beta-xylanase